MKNLLKKLFGFNKKKQTPVNVEREALYPDPKVVKTGEINKFIKTSTPEQVENWYYHYKSKGHYFFDNIYTTVQDKIASSDDNYYFDILKDMDSEEAKDFFREEKKDKVYFSDKVYEAFMRKINEDKNPKFLELIESSTPEKILTWYLKQEGKEGFEYLNSEVEEKAHKKIFSIIETGKIAKRYREKFIDYALNYLPPRIDDIIKSQLYIDLIQDKLNEVDGKNKRIYYRSLGEAEEARGNFELAIDYFDKSMKTATQEYHKASDAERLGACQVKIGLIEEGVDNFELAAHLDSSQQARIYRKIGEIFEEKEDYVKTVFYFERAISANPKIGIKRKLSKYKEKIGK